MFITITKALIKMKHGNFIHVKKNLKTELVAYIL